MKDTSHGPPKLAHDLLHFILKSQLLEEVLGDMEENYLFQKETHSKRQADLQYWYQTLNYLRPFAIRSDILTKLNPFMMWRHNLVITLRKFKRNKTSFFINLIGLSTALAAALLMLMWVQDEMSIDTFDQKADHLYQVMHNLDLPSEIFTLEETPVPLAKAMAAEMPEVEYAVTVNDFFNWGRKKGVLTVGEQSTEVKGIHAGEDFFQVFSYPMLEGSRNEVLKGKSGIVISESVATKLFGSTENVVGRSVQWDHVAYDGDFQIEGVFKDPPTNATDQFEVILHLSHLTDNDRWANQWTGSYGKTYFTLNPASDINSVKDKLAATMQVKCERCTESSLFPFKYSDKYLYGDFVNGVASGKGRHVYVKLFSLTALFLLLIACANFMNLSTAEAARKMKEIGVRKTVGATRRSLILQLQSESVLLSTIALLFALTMVVLLLPEFNHISGKELQLKLSGNLILATAGITLFTGLLSGSYPALYLSRFKPAQVIKGKLDSNSGDFWIRKGLVIFQFSLSLIFIVSLLVVNQQVDYSQTKDMGYERENVISFPWKGELYDNWNGLGEEGNSNEKYYTFIAGLSNIPGVVHATQMNGNILDNVIGQSGITVTGDASEESFNVKSPVVGYDFMKTLGIDVVAGRSFSRDRNDSYFTTIMVNETAAKLIGFENPIGEKIHMNGENEIIGVVKDFQYGSLYNGIEPFIFRFDKHLGNILVKVDGSGVQETVAALESLYQEFLPGQSLDFRFLDDDYQQQYESELRLATLSRYFAGLAILISCLGLFGLAMFMAARRKKEIGVRKILGSTVLEIVQMLGRDFTKTVLIAILIATPVSYYIARQWLSNFEYSIDLQVWYFLLPALIVLSVSWLTVGVHTIRAAQLNPVEALKAQ